MRDVEGMKHLHPKPTLLALLKAERDLTGEIMDRWEALVVVKKQIAEREAEVSEEGSNRHTMH
jgi:hypothetical protein